MIVFDMGQQAKEVEKQVLDYINEARQLLPDLPDNITFVWRNNLIIPGNGTGGTLLEPSLLGIGYDPNFKNKELLARNLRSTVLHECFHAVQGWSDEKPKLKPETLLEDGVLEGAATVFEREFGQTNPPWSQYENDKTMLLWFEEIKDLELDLNNIIYNDYKFGEIDGHKWMLYKLGTWVVDRALKLNPDLSIADFAGKDPKEIIELAAI